VENQLDLTAQRGGTIASINADVGKSVRKGDLLAQIDDREATADRDAAASKVRSIEADVKNWEAEVKVLESDQQRAEKEWESQLITKEQLDHVRFKVVADRYELEREQQNLQNAKDQLRSRELELEKSRIQAPFDGMVARRYVRAGQQVSAGDRMFWVTAVAPLRVKFTLPEKFLGKVHMGQQVTVTAAETESASHQAKIIQISPVVDPASDTIEVLAELLGPAGDLRPGMSANVRLENLR
jgi:RND family efflux transporter MFP subunit